MSRFRLLFSPLAVGTLTFLAAPSDVRAQGVTTATLSGVVADSATNEPISGATVVALHVPTGTQYRALTRSSGAYTLPNVRIGGPYRVTVRAAIGPAGGAARPGTRRGARRETRRGG